ncbi:MAG: flagellar biosynthetic protein FliR [Pirellulales bacterium]
MSWLESLLITKFAVFALILGRVGALVMTAPVFGTQALPMQVRGLLAVALSLLVMPLHTTQSPPGDWNLLDFSLLMVNEVLVGLLLGVGVTILFTGVQLAGHLISQLSGLSLAEVFDPAIEEQASVFTQLFYFLTLAMFVALGGHRLVMQALLDTFVWAPPGHAELGDNYIEAVVTLLTQSFRLGIRAAAPLMASLLLATVLLGLIGRTLPQINVLVLGFGVNSLLTLAMLLITIGGVAWTFQEPLTATLEVLSAAVVHRNS